MEYVLSRKTNCTKIKIRVIEGVVQVSAPFSVSKKVIDEFVHEQEAWIKEQMDKNPILKNNDIVELLGESFHLHFIDVPRCYVEKDQLYLFPNKELIQRFLKKNAKKYFDLNFFASNYRYTIFLYNMVFIKVNGVAVRLRSIKFVSM